MWSYLWGQLIERLRDRSADHPRLSRLRDLPDSGQAVGLETDSPLLESFVDQLGLHELTLVVQDLGGPVGLGLATRRPERVTGLVLVNTFAWPPHIRSLRFTLSLMSSRPVRGLNAGTNLMAKAISGRFGIGRHLSKGARHAFVGPFRGSKGPRRRIHTLIGSVRMESEHLEDIERVLRSRLGDTPVLTVFGQRNDLFRFQARFKEIFPNVSEMMIANGNHFPMCDDPDRFAERVAQWHK